MPTALAVLAAALWVVRLGLFAALHLVRSEYDPVRHAVSDYAVGSTRALSRAMTWLTGAAWAATAGAVASGYSAWDDAGAIVAMLIVLAGVFAVLPFVPTDLEGAQRTALGVAHLALAVAWFAISYTASGNLLRHLEHGSVAALSTALAVLHTIAMVSLIALVVALVVRRLRPYAFGTSERIFIVALNLFYLLAAVAMIAGR